jgi:Coenzyme PQQ synthesis protein D (PqqD)
MENTRSDVPGEVRWRARPADEVAWREVDDEVVLLDLRTSMYWSLNGAAAVLWVALADGSSLEELSLRLVTEYGLDPATARRDAWKFLESCLKEDLLLTM